MKLKGFLGILVIGLAALTVLAGCGVNKSIHSRDGETLDGGTSTVNGSIHIGNNCTVTSTCTTVNGNISIGSDCRVQTLTGVNSGIDIGKDTVVDGDIITVNGGVSLEEKVRANKGIKSVNGSIRLAKGCEVEEDVITVNGDISLTNAGVKGNIILCKGDVTLKEGSTAAGDIIYRESKGFSLSGNSYEIRISDNSVVKGDIIVEDEDIEVRVVLSGNGKVLGKIKNAKTI